MNKYLSYERSKRLAELGYALENPTIWVQSDCNNENRYVTQLGPASGFFETYQSYDCHDLLMELQKQKKEVSSHTGNWNFRMSADGDWSFDSHIGKINYLVEALGAALIKLLEEKQ